MTIRCHGYIYALVDTKRNLVGYVGKSIDPEGRFFAHIEEGKAHFRLSGNCVKPPVTMNKAKWIAYLLQENNPPVMIILEAVVGQFAWIDSEENDRIIDMLRDNQPLTNARLPWDLMKQCDVTSHDGFMECPYNET